jgi:hypothetical protein
MPKQSYSAIEDMHQNTVLPFEQPSVVQNLIVAEDVYHPDGQKLEHNN